jgi:transcriptional regulator with XRE-family HTH domain
VAYVVHMDIMNRLGVLAKDELKARNITGEAAAEAAGIARTTLGRRLASPGDFTLAELERFAPLLNVTSDELIAKARKGTA